MDGSKYRPKGAGMAGVSKKLAYVLLLLLALAAAALSVVVLHKVRERQTFAVLLRERDRQLISTRIFLQKEKAFNKEMKRKLEELKATTSSLRTQKTDLKTKIKGLEATMTTLKNKEKELEAALVEKKNQLEATATNLKNKEKELEAALKEKNSRINQMEEKATGSNPDQMAALMELLQSKEAELEEIKVRFQDYKIPEKRSVGSKSTPVQINNANAKPDNAVKKFTRSSDATPTKSEEESYRNTTTSESKHPKDRSLEEKQIKSTTNTEDDGLQDKTDDVIEDIDDIYGESHSSKPKFPRQSKKFLTNSRVDSQEELDRIGHSGNSLDQDSDRVRYNKLLEKENEKVSGETKEKKNIDGNLEKISKHSLSDANKNRSKQAVEDMAGAAGVKLNMSVNDDGAQQQNKRHKKKKNRSKKKIIDATTINDDGGITKQKEVDAISIPE
uniref:Uncharacterized protein n=1 Tax=Leersia perrieri TaxID=77586 RepID=A0A0D9X4Y7_9ORYZ